MAEDREYIYTRANDFKTSTVFTVKMRFEDSEYIGEIEELEIYAYGDSQEEVLEELRADLIDLYEHYNQVSDVNLGEDPKKWKKILSSNLSLLQRI